MEDTTFIKRSLSEILCCPACRQDLELIKSRLQCLSCLNEYNIQDGILSLLVSGVNEGQIDELELRENVARKHRDKTPEKILETVSQHHCLSLMSQKAKNFRRKFDPNQWILDIGCGTSYYWSDTKGGNLILLDFGLENLKVSKTLIKEQNSVLFVQADAANLPIKTHSLSGIWSVQVTQHFPDIVMKPFLEEVKRVLKDEFSIEIYNLNPAWLYKFLYGLHGKQLVLRGKTGGMVISRLNADELSDLWKGVVQNSRVEIGYSELFFHPMLGLKPRGNYIKIPDNLFSNLPWLARALARQIMVKISSL